MRRTSRRRDRLGRDPCVARDVADGRVDLRERQSEDGSGCAHRRIIAQGTAPARPFRGSRLVAWPALDEKALRTCPAPPPVCSNSCAWSRPWPPPPLAPRAASLSRRRRAHLEAAEGAERSDDAERRSVAAAPDATFALRNLAAALPALEGPIGAGQRDPRAATIRRRPSSARAAASPTCNGASASTGPGRRTHPSTMRSSARSRRTDRSFFRRERRPGLAITQGRRIPRRP